MSIVQECESHFIDSHYIEIWSLGVTPRNKDGEGGADEEFGSKVVHILTNHNGNHTVEGFMRCLKWYIAARLKHCEDITVNRRDMIEYIIYGTDDDGE
jgi:hypothetical protein